MALHLWSNTTHQSVLGLLVQRLDFDPQGHVIAALGRVALGDPLLVSLVLAIDAGQGDPLAKASADFCVGTLHVHYIRAFLAHAVAVGGDAQVHDIAGHAGSDVETLGDVAVLGLVDRTTIGVELGAGQWHALADLDQCRRAFAGLDLLDTAIAAVGAARIIGTGGR